MKKIIFLLPILSILLLQCTPKSGEQISKKPEVQNTKPLDFRSTAPAPAPAPRIQMGEAEQFVLDNGLTVIVVENHKLPRVSYQLFIDVPPLTEGDAAGTVDMAGDLLSKGTASKSKSEIDESIDYIGARLSTNANGMYGASLKKYHDQLLEIMSDVLLHPAFPEEEFEKLKKQNASGLAQSKEDPSTLSAHLRDRVLYGKEHPYGEFMTEETLENIHLDGIKKYYDTWFNPKIAYLIVVGDITRAEVEPLARKYFSNWKSKEVLQVQVPDAKPPKGNQVSFIHKSGAVQSVVKVAYPVDLPPDSPDAIKARVMNTLLGAGVYFGNRLNQNLREDKAYTYGARSRLSSDKYAGNFSAGASVRNEVTDSAIVEILKEMTIMRTVRVDDDELQKVKNVLNGSFARSLESPQTIARFALNIARYGLPKDYYATYLEKLAAVSNQDVMTMANKYIQPDNAHIIVVGEQGEVAAKLAPFDADGAVQFYNKNYEKIEQPKMEIPMGLTAHNIIDDYLNAIGGSEVIEKIKTTAIKMKGNIMGQNISVEVYQQLPDKYASFTSMGPSVIQAEVYNAGKGKISGMGGEKVLTGDDLADMKEKVFPVKERRYKDSEAYQLELQGIEEVEGKPAYKIKVRDPAGGISIEYFDVDSKLKVRSIITTEAQGQTMTQIIDLHDYKEVAGVLYPHRVHISGGGIPMPLDMKAESVKVNVEIEASVFDISK